MNLNKSKIMKVFLELSKTMKENFKYSRNTSIRKRNQILSVIFSNFSINLGDPPPGFERFAKPSTTQKQENIKEKHKNKQNEGKKDKK